MKILSYKVTGTTPLLMHSDVTANPLNAYTKKLKAITGKRKKTDEDYELIAEIEFEASLYHNDHIGYYMPSANIDATLLSSAKMFKLGVLWKQAAIVVDDCKFLFKDSKLSPIELYNTGKYIDQRTVKIGTSKTFRTRPVFREWGFEVAIILDEAKLNEQDIDNIFNNAGAYVGICDYRPRFGRFEVEKM